MPVYSMPIANRKEMETLLVAKVWRQCIRVLVHFVRVAWLETTGCCKSELCYNVKPLILN